MKSVPMLSGAFLQPAGQSLPEPLLALRNERAAALADMPMPTRKTENWKYSSKYLKLTEDMAATLPATEKASNLDVPGYRIVLNNGAINRADSRYPDQGGITVQHFSVLDAGAVDLGKLRLLRIEGAAKLLCQGAGVVRIQVAEVLNGDAALVRVPAVGAVDCAVIEHNPVAGDVQVAGLFSGRQGGGHVFGQLQVLAGVFPVFGFPGRHGHVGQCCSPLVTQCQQRFRQGLPGRLQECAGKHRYRFHSAAS